MDEYVHKKVDRIEFGFMGPKAIKEMASAKIVTPELYDKEGYPVDGGLMDIRLGVIDPGLKCKTCGVNLALIVGTINAGSGAPLEAGRLLSVRGCDNAIPGKFFGVGNPVTRIPYNNIILVGIITLAGALLLTFLLGDQFVTIEINSE